jgi:cyclase
VARPMPRFETGLVELGSGTYAYVQYDGSWGISNAGCVVTREGVVVIDALLVPSMTRDFMRAMASVTSKTPIYLVNTHAHRDHTSGNYLFDGVPIIAHAGCRAELMEAWSTPFDVRAARWARSEALVREAMEVRPRFPMITFDTRLDLHADDVEIQLLHWGPAHSKGDCVVYLPRARAAFIGDLGFFHDTPLAHASILNSIRTMDRLADLDVEVIVPGHGPVGGREEVREVRDYLAFVAEHGENAFWAGLSPAEAAASINPGEYTVWGQWEERLLMNLEALYRELGATARG